jgi:hypothetical protein
VVERHATELSGGSKMSRRILLTIATLLSLATVLATCCSGDCAWSADFKTWIDANENGIWDADESPLPGVKIFVESSVLRVPEVTSNEKGEVHLDEALGGCPKDAVFFVYVLPPSGYRPSIRMLYPAQEQTERVFEFGFVSVSD